MKSEKRIIKTMDPVEEEEVKSKPTTSRDEQEDCYQLEQRRVYVNCLMERIKQIWQTDDNEEIGRLWKGMEQAIEDKFAQFIEEEKKEKILGEEISSL